MIDIVIFNLLNVKTLGCKIENLEIHDWPINFSSFRHRDKDLSQVDFLEKLFDIHAVFL